LTELQQKQHKSLRDARPTLGGNYRSASFAARPLPKLQAMLRGSVVIATVAMVKLVERAFDLKVLPF
jgi:hypothetical protein